ncbi:hypothetical protein [Nonomuraea sp. NPDC049400]|uniref:hypothetical protein n=1 Tax=Nonomuraea sp. NPDC049400 TaxID=3364352 RepID=UPI00379F01BD
MGRHSSTPAKPEPKQTPIHRAWRRLPQDFRKRVWEWRKQWRTYWDRRHTPPGDWDAQLPKDPANWTDDLNWGSFTVAAALWKHRRERGDLLPRRPHHQEQS